MSECDPSDQAVSVIVVVVSMNFFLFFEFSQIPARICFKFCVDVPCVDVPIKFVKIGVLPLFFMELWVILCNFWPILRKSSIKPLTRNHSYLVWRVPRGSSF